MLIWSIGMAAVLLVFAAIKIAGVRLQEKQNLSQQMAAEVPLVIESQKLLEKLRQNKLGGIDPFGAIVRMANQRTGSNDDSDLTFTHAHFESRNEVKLEGEGKTIEAINTFIENLEKNQIASIRISKSGDEKRKIESEGDKTTFEIEFDLIEQNLPSPVSVQTGSAPPSKCDPMMNALKKVFFKLNDREQLLLLLSAWVVVVICFLNFSDWFLFYIKIGSLLSRLF